MGRPSLLSVLLCLLAAVGLAAVPPNIVAEGVPPVPAALTTELTPYLNLGGASFRGWHSTRRETIVTSRIGDATHLHAMAAPLAKRVALTGGVEPVKGGQMQPGGTQLLYAADAGGNENFQLYLKDTTDPKAPLSPTLPISGPRTRGATILVAAHRPRSPPRRNEDKQPVSSWASSSF